MTTIETRLAALEALHPELGEEASGDESAIYVLQHETAERQGVRLVVNGNAIRVERKGVWTCGEWADKSKYLATSPGHYAFIEDVVVAAFNAGRQSALSESAAVRDAGRELVRAVKLWNGHSLVPGSVAFEKTVNVLAAARKLEGLLPDGGK